MATQGTITRDGLDIVKNALACTMAARMSVYPQYQGHWDEDKRWKLAVTKYPVTTGVGTIPEGEMVLVKLDSVEMEPCILVSYLFDTHDGKKTVYQSCVQEFSKFLVLER